MTPREEAARDDLRYCSHGLAWGFCLFIGCPACKNTEAAAEAAVSGHGCIRCSHGGMVTRCVPCEPNSLAAGRCKPCPKCAAANGRRGN